MPSKRSTALLLADMQEAIGHAQDFTRDLTLTEFQSSAQIRLATQRALEIVSEAGKNLPDDLKERHPEIPWRDMTDTGNLYRHAYHDILDPLTLKTVRDYLPPLLAMVTAELTALETPTERDDTVA